MTLEDPIDKWGIIKLYSAAYKKESWIECISLGYTMLEMGLQYLLKSKACPTGKPLSDSIIYKQRYLIELAKLALKKEFLPQSIYDEIKLFNESRKKAIHRLLSENVTLAELKNAAEMVSPLYGKIQSLWLEIKVGPVEQYSSRKGNA